MAKQVYLGRMEFSAGKLAFSIDVDPPGSPSALTLTAGEYYPSGYTGEGVGLVEEIQTQLRTIDGAATCTLNIVTGIPTITFAASTAITWTDVDLRNHLGWTGDLATSTSHVSPNPIRGLWRPSFEHSRRPTSLKRFWESSSSTRSMQGPDGTAHGQAGGRQRFAGLRYDHLPQADVEISDDEDQTDNSAFERWLEDVPHAAQPIRCVVDRDTYAATTDYKVALFGSPNGGDIGGFRDWADPTLGEENHDLWDVDLFLFEYTGV